MMNNNGRSSYLQAKVETASPQQLILMLYDELIKTLLQTKDFIHAKKIEDSHSRLIKSQMILGELTGSLNISAGPLAINLLSLYQYISNQLIEINVKKDPTLIAPVLEIVGSLRDAWWTGVMSAPENLNAPPLTGASILR